MAASPNPASALNVSDPAPAQPQQAQPYPRHSHPTRSNGSIATDKLEDYEDEPIPVIIHVYDLSTPFNDKCAYTNLPFLKVFRYFSWGFGLYHSGVEVNGCLFFLTNLLT